MQHCIMISDYIIYGLTDRMVGYNTLISWKPEYGCGKGSPGGLQPVSGMFQFCVMGCIVAGIGGSGLFAYEGSQLMISQQGG